MKKEYVKPVMESEAFVSSEYIAACYTATCIGDCDATSIECKDTGDSAAFYNSIVGSEKYDDVYFYTGAFGNEPATECMLYEEDTAPDWADNGWGALWWWILTNFFGASGTTITHYHPVTVVKGWGENHPEASI